MGYRTSQEFAPTNGQVLFIRQDVDPVSSELWLNLLHGAEMEGERRGLSVVPRQARYLHDPASIDSSVVGLILAVPYPAELSGVAARIGLPVVCAGYVGVLERVDQVVGADWEAGVAVGRFLMGKGHREIAFVHGNPRLLGRAERFRGLRDAMREVEGTTVSNIVFDESAGFREAFLTHLRGGGAPTALFCAHDGIAVNVISELARLDIRVPDDVSVVGFNDFISASQVAPRLTTVRTPQMELGAAMMRCIADRALNPDFQTVPPLRITLVSELIERGSTGPAAPTAWLSRCLAAAG
jgi:LacI family transcriptional regulator